MFREQKRTVYAQQQALACTHKPLADCTYKKGHHNIEADQHKENVCCDGSTADSEYPLVEENHRDFCHAVNNMTKNDVGELQLAKD
jgi:hypothetical protein